MGADASGPYFTAVGMVRTIPLPERGEVLEWSIRAAC